MQISFVMLIFLLFSEPNFREGQKSSRGGGGKLPQGSPPVEGSQYHTPGKIS